MKKLVIEFILAILIFGIGIVVLGLAIIGL